MDNNNLIFEFENMEEFVLYSAINKDKLTSDVKWIKGDDYKDLVKEAYSLNEAGRHDEAIETLEYSLKFNPIGIVARFELAETYIMKKDYSTALNSLLSMKPYLVNKRNIARFYRRLGYIYIEFSNFELAYACFVASKKLEESDVANNEIAYIRSKTKIGLMFDYKYTLTRYNIPLIGLN